MNVPHNTPHASWFKAWDRLPLALIAMTVTYGIGNEAFGGPRYTRSYVTRARTCQANLKRIVGAKAQRVREQRLQSAEQLPDGVLWGAGAFLPAPPVCPSGGEYTVGPVGTLPSCSEAGRHSLGK